MNETDPRTISRLVKDTENLLYTYRHPDPYICTHSLLNMRGGAFLLF
jgi:hypothetical protein